MSAVSHLKVTNWKVILRQLCGNNYTKKNNIMHMLVDIMHATFMHSMIPILL